MLVDVIVAPLHISALEVCFFFQAEDGIRDYKVTGVQTCALPIYADGVSGVFQVSPDLSTLTNVLAGSNGSVPLPTGQTHGSVLGTAVTGSTGGSKIGRASCRERV